MWAGALLFGCEVEPGAIQLMDGGIDALPPHDSSGLSLLAPPPDPAIRATAPALGDPPAAWLDPPECPLATDDQHCETCWSWTDLGPASLGRNESGDDFGRSLAVGDFNGDGYPDLAVGAPGEDNGGGTDAGSVFVYLGSSRGFQPWQHLEGGAAGLRFGSNLITIDLDDTDDVDDLVVASGGTSVEGIIVVYDGHASSFGSSSTTFALSDLDPAGRDDVDSELGAALAVGDFDGDGDEDLAVGAPNYLTSSMMMTNHGAVFRLVNAAGALTDNGRIDGAADGDRFGASLAAGALGGSNDYLVVGAPEASSGAGAVYEYDGTSVHDTHSSGSSLGNFGRSVAVGNLRSASGNEIVVGGTGEAFVEIVGLMTPLTVSGAMNVTELAPVAVGDLDRDGATDLALEMVQTSGLHTIRFFRQSAGEQVDWTALSLSGRETDDELGSAAALLDLDGDGTADLVLAAPAPGAVNGDVHLVLNGDGVDWTASTAADQTVDQETEITACDECTVYARPDGSTECGDDGDVYICVFGVCQERGCGDGYRQTGEEMGVSWSREGCDDGNLQPADACSTACTPTLLYVSSRVDANDRPSALPPAVAEDGELDLLFVFGAEVGEVAELRGQRATYGGDLYPTDPDPKPPMGGGGGGEPTAMLLPGSGGEAHVLATFPGTGWDPEASVTGLPSGGWWVAWTSPTEDGAGTGIAMRFVANDGTLGSTRVANQTVLGEQSEPRLATLENGFVVVWTDASGMDGPFGQSVIKARRFDASGSPVEDEWVVSDPDTSASQPALAAIGGLFLVAYASHPPDPFELPAVVAQRFGSGSPDSEPFIVSDTDGAEPALSVLDGSTFLAAWTQRDSERLGDIQSRTVPDSGVPPMLGSIVTHGNEDTLDVAPSIAAYDNGYFVAWQGEDFGRRISIDYTAMSVADEIEDLNPLLRNGLQADVTLLTTSRGTWFAWSDAHRFGTGALRSFVAYLLPGS